MIPPLKNVKVHAHFLRVRPVTRYMVGKPRNREVDFWVFAHACMWKDAFSKIMNKREGI